jgi:curved DNA-binding protein CbpA
MRVGETVGTAHAQVLALAPGVAPTSLSLDPAAGYLLSRIDGHTNWGTLRQIGALPPHEVDRLVERWLKEGIVVASAASAIRTAPPGSASKPLPPPRVATAAQPKPAASAAKAGGKPAEPPRAPAAPPPAMPASALPTIDASLDLDVELQGEILAFANGLGRKYHEILGVAANADAKAVKKAYFVLSKKLHPDRYFRRNTGAFGPLIETCFKRLLEAYELLSDPATRVAVEAAQLERTTQRLVQADAGAAANARASSLDARRRLRERVSTMHAHARHHDGQRRKAKGFFEHGMSAFAAGKWIEAAGAVRLAIAFDPDNFAYREEFPNVQRKAHDERAKHLVKQAESALEMRDYAAALDHFEEALLYRPADAELAFRSAKLSVQISGDLKRSKEFAAQAVECAPENGEYRKLLAGIFAAAGLRANAKREFEAALRIAPDDKDARAGLRSVS